MTTPLHKAQMACPPNYTPHSTVVGSELLDFQRKSIVAFYFSIAYSFIIAEFLRPRIFVVWSIEATPTLTKHIIGDVPKQKTSDSFFICFLYSPFQSERIMVQRIISASSPNFWHLANEPSNANICFFLENFQSSPSTWCAFANRSQLRQAIWYFTISI